MHESGMKLFLNQWVVELHYGNAWHQVVAGTLEELEITALERYARYRDRYDNNYVLVDDAIITGYKYVMPDPNPDPNSNVKNIKREG